MVKRFRAEITGKVQGVFFRVFAQRQATALGLKGFVKNLSNGSVLLEAEGEDTGLDVLLRWCEHGPPGAQVDRVSLSWLPPHGESGVFDIAT